MKHPQGKFPGSLGAAEFQAAVDRIRARPFFPLSRDAERRARLVLVDGVTVRGLSVYEGVSRFTLYKPIQTVFRAARDGS